MCSYYPFGLKQKGYNTDISPSSNSLAQQWKYNGTELNESLGLNLYEMNARNYDPAIARFVSVDPIVHFSQSTYAAFDNNPIFWSDPIGANSETFWKSKFLKTNVGRWTDDLKNRNNETTDSSDININEDEESTIDSKPLTRKALGDLLGTSDPEKIADRFEQLFQEWGNINYWTFSVPNEHYKSKDFGEVLPDGYSVGMTLGGNTLIAPNVSLWDAKATGTSTMGENFVKDRQLKAYIQILSELNIKNTTKNALIYVTTSDVVNVNAIRSYADSKGVSFRHIVAYSEWGVLGRYLVFKEREWIGVPKGGGARQRKMKHPGPVSVILEWSPIGIPRRASISSASMANNFF